MSPALDGWIAAAPAIAVMLVQWRAGAIKAEAVTRACHELRGPLTAARLGLQLGGRTGGLSGERMRAIDLELGRAALALEDLGSAGVVSARLTRVRLAGAGRGQARRYRRRRAARRPWLRRGRWLRPSGRLRLTGLVRLTRRLLQGVWLCPSGWFSPSVWRPRLEVVRAPMLVDLPALVADSAGAWGASAEAAGVELHAQWEGAGAAVEGDRFRIAQVTGNLIANAIEHGGGRVEVRGRCTQGGVRIEVVDGGPGLPAPVAELARRARRGRGERGRGLAIALDVVHAHGGRLAAAPSERGARLVLELPVAAWPASAPRAPEPGGPVPGPSPPSAPDHGRDPGA